MNLQLRQVQLPGGLELRQELGESRFGSTYMAADTLGQKRVIKISHDEFDVQLLQRELRVGQMLSHPNLVRVHDVFTDDSGRAVLIREWIEGRSLEEIIADGPVRVRDTFEVIEAVGRGLSVMHAHGFIHRDVKPANILVPFEAHRPQFHKAKLADYGLVAALDLEFRRREVTTTPLTQAGLLVGTVLYMAPEQATGSTVSTATDIHALGIVLYELLYGRVPFAEDTMVETLYAIFHNDIRLPAQPKFPTALRRLMLRSTRKKSADRPQSAAEFLEELAFAKQAVAATGMLAFFGLTRGDLPSRQVSDNRGVLLLSGGLIVAALAGAGWLLSSDPNVSTALMGTGTIAAGAAAGGAVRRFLMLRRRAADAAAQIILGVEDLSVLTRSLVIQIEELVERCERVDQKILGTGLILQLQEYRHATTFEERQLAFKNTMELLDKLFQRLLPWHLRHERLLVFLVSLLGIVPGMASFVTAVMRSLR